MSERDLELRRGGGLRRGAVEPLSPQAWQRVESAVFARLDAAAVPWSTAPAPLHSYAAPRAERSLRLHWATSVGLALASAAAAASVLHLTRPPPQLEAGPPAELMMPERAAPALPAVERARASDRARPSEPAQTAAPVPLEFPRPLPDGISPGSRPSPVNLLSRAGGRALAPGALVHPELARASSEPASVPRRPVHREPAPLDERERWFERAASLEAADAPLALALYLSLATGDDAWAANALYAAARLEIDRGEHEPGAAHLAEYLARFPRGENIVDVRRLRQRIGIEAR